MINTTRAFKSRGDFSENDLTLSPFAAEGGRTDYAAFLRDYIHRNYARPIRLKDLSVITHVHVSYLSALFKKRYGRSFSEYLLSYRLQKAAEMIGSTKLQLKEVAVNVGYVDYPQFMKLFKRVYGLSPQDYRREKRNEA